MNKKVFTRVVLGSMMLAAMGVLSGCGTEKIGYVDQQILVNKSQKGQEISQQVADKEKELTDKLAAVQQSGDQAAFEKAQSDAQREYSIFKSSKAKELETFMDDNIGQVAKDESMNVVLSKSTIITGGEDLTDKVLDKIGRAPEKTAESDQNQAAGQE